MDIIQKNKNQINYNEENEFIDDDVEPNTAPKRQKIDSETYISKDVSGVTNCST